MDISPIALARAARSYRELMADESWRHGVDWIEALERYIGGESMKSIARDYMVTESMLRMAMAQDPVRAEMWQEAQAQRAWSAADRVIDVAEALQPTIEEVEEALLDQKGRVVYDADGQPVTRKVKARRVASNEECRAADALIKALQWTAGKLNPTQFGDKAMIDARLTVTHEDALRQIIDMEVPEHGG